MDSERLPDRALRLARAAELELLRSAREAVRAGRTFITTAPLITLSVAGQEPGSVVKVERGQRVRLRAEAQSGVPFDYLDILVNGEVQVTKSASGNQTSAVIETDFVCHASAWVAATCYAPTRLRSGTCVFAHTNPVYLDVPGAPLRPSAETVAPLLDILERTRRWVEKVARCPAEKQRRHLYDVLDQATRRLGEGRGEA